LELRFMVRLRGVTGVVGAIGAGCLMAACAVSSPDVAQLGFANSAGATERPALRSGLGLASKTAKADTTEQAVELNSSAKAPKGALADRDYSGAQLDVDLALKLINDYRASNGLKALRLDPKLTAAAKVHARDLAKTDRISHYGSDGSSPWDRVKRAGYTAKIAAENVGTGQASLQEVFKGWEQSPGHNRNLLLPGAKDMGIALIADPKTEFKTFWTLIVGSSS
jgi:uncharacterized protein YkwD